MAYQQECYFCLRENSTRKSKDNVYISLGKLVKGSPILNVQVESYELVRNKNVNFEINYCPICGRKL